MAVGGRRGLFVGLALAGLCVGLLALYLGSRSSRIPIQEARRFLHAPIEVGESRPAPEEGQASPALAEERFGEAQRAFASADYAQAAEAYAAVVAADPDGPLAGRAQWNLTRSRLRSGDGNGALDGLDSLLAHYADYLQDESPSLRSGIDWMAKGEMPEAQAAFDRMIEEQPDSDLVPIAWALKARIYWNHGQPWEAVAAFGSLFSSVKDDVKAYDDLGGLLARYAEGDTSVAEDFAAKADESGEGFQDFYQYLAARSLLEQNRFEETREALEALRAAHPDGDFTHIVDLEHAWNLFRRGDAAEALEIFERLEREATPDRARAFDAFFDIRAELPMGMARCYLALGDYEKSIAYFKQAIASHPRSIYVMENQMGMSLAYERLGRFDEAVALLQTTIEQNPDEPNLGAVRQQLARMETAAAEPRSQ